MTKKQIQRYKDYLSFSVDLGYIDESEANDIIKRKAWNEVEEMMDKGDYYANMKEGDLDE